MRAIHEIQALNMPEHLTTSARSVQPVQVQDVGAQQVHDVLARRVQPVQLQDVGAQQVHDVAARLTPRARPVQIQDIFSQYTRQALHQNTVKTPQKALKGAQPGTPVRPSSAFVQSPATGSSQGSVISGPYFSYKGQELSGKIFLNQPKSGTNDLIGHLLGLCIKNAGLGNDIKRILAEHKVCHLFTHDQAWANIK